ncbi:clathrin light chain-domain-containing protein [Mycena rebaudengoi]|nr:clathrin light chain-domain-containing protein [Mycena rebaudengoi]
MSDFTSFTSGAADDDIDFDAAASAFPALDDDLTAASSNFGASSINSFDTNSFGTNEFSTPTATGDANFFLPLDEPQTVVKVTGDDELEKFTSEFPEIDAGPMSPPAHQQPTFGAPRPQPSAFSSTPILSHQLEEDEPQVIKDWRARQADEIKARDEASRARRQETITRAEKAIDDFYETYAAKKERTIRDNKDQEKHYLEHLTSSLSAGTTWQRICELVELENSQSKTVARAGPGTTELSRFKEVLLRLKREGDAAPGAGGY